MRTVLLALAVVCVVLLICSIAGSWAGSNFPELQHWTAQKRWPLAGLTLLFAACYLIPPTAGGFSE